MADAITITNYDVLLGPTDTPDGSYSERQLVQNQGHVGNNRLQVFLNMYQQSYDTARKSNSTSECDAIVSKIVNTVCQQCFPPGRFLFDVSGTSSNNECAEPVWSILDESEAMKFIHAILQPSPAPAASLSTGSDANSSSNSVKAENINNNVDGQKRRRRSSLLRRSASESMVGMASLSSSMSSSGNSSLISFVGGKKKVREVMEEPTWSSSRSTSKNGIITSLNRMDVILTSSRDALDPNSQSVGNNRLHILVAMQSGKYQQATADGREVILDEVIQTVNTFWKGRFLTESDVGYEELPKDVARNALRSIFDMRSGQSLLTSRQRTEPLIIPDRSLSHGMAGGYPSTGINTTSSASAIGMLPNSTGLIKQASTSMILSGGASGDGRPIISDDTKMGLARQVSTSVIPTQHIPVSLPEVGELRSAAVKSLQKQRARQNIASRLEKGARRFIPPVNQIVSGNLSNNNYNSRGCSEGGGGGGSNFHNNNISNPMFRGSVTSNISSNEGSSSGFMLGGAGSVGSNGWDTNNNHRSSNFSAGSDLHPVAESRVDNAGLASSTSSSLTMASNAHMMAVGVGMNGNYSSAMNARHDARMASAAKKRQSTVFTTLDPGVMEQLVADFDDADCNDDDDDDIEPLPR